MCFVAGRLDPGRSRPLLVMANRDEFYDRQGTLPRYEESSPRSYVAPRDSRAGGSWFGLNQAGLIVTLTNRPTSNPRAEAPSRGLLVRDLLVEAGSLRDTRDRVKELNPDRFNPFLLLVLSPDGLLGLKHGLDREDRWFRHRAGHFFLSNRTGFDFFEDDEDQRFPWSPHTSESTANLMSRLRAFCRRHEGFLDRPYLCGHAEEAGTLSSSILAVDQRRVQLLFDFAQGAPCETPYRPQSLPTSFRQNVLRAWTGDEFEPGHDDGTSRSKSVSPSGSRT